MKNIYNYIKKNILIFALFFATCFFLFVNLKINFFRYHNFDLGKFDLGNMTQMVWNVSQGNGLWLTDYFGTNLPRWAMSHVDPILYIFVPIFMIFPHPMTLVVSQLVLVLFSSLLIYLIAEIHLKNKLSAFLLGMTYLFTPSIGFLTAWTAFHGVTVVIPFFLGAFYLFEKSHQVGGMNKTQKVLFWLLLILTMMGKEQVPLYIFCYGIFILILRNGAINKFADYFRGKNTKLAISMMLVSIVWFFMAFFVIIPKNAHYRAEGYKQFAQLMELEDTAVRDVDLPNYFLNRYDAFGETYSEVILNILTKPRLVIEVFFSGDKVENLSMTFTPFLFLPFVHPFSFFMAVPDMMINYMASSGGVGTAEIMNHRVSMIVPVLFISTILGISYLQRLIRKRGNILALLFSGILLVMNIYTSHQYQNPVYLWMTQAFKKKLVGTVLAKTDEKLAQEDLEVGDVVKLSELEQKDRECALKIVESIPAGVSVSGPDSLGAHLSMRETYAIFPALYNSADYIIVDVFARKILTILDTNVEIVKDVVADLIKDDNYRLNLGCGNYFVFEKVGSHEKADLLPIQERYNYEETVNFEFFQGVSVVNFSFPEEVKKGEKATVEVTYFRSTDNSQKDSRLDQFILFTSFIHKESGEIYQLANLPSFALTSPSEWSKNRYYLESIEFRLPQFLEVGEYKVFIGMGNKIRSRSMYLGDIKVL